MPIMHSPRWGSAIPGLLPRIQSYRNDGKKLDHQVKGPSRLILTQEDRAAILCALNCVDVVIFFEDDTPIHLIQALQPDILVKGGDYTLETVVGSELMAAWGGRVEILDLEGGKSTTAIVEKIRNGGKMAAAANHGPDLGACTTAE